MAGLLSFSGYWGRLFRCGAVVWACGLGLGAQEVGAGLRAWKEAAAARVAFEEEPVGQHTKVAYAEVMEGFRAIYHGNPGNLYAPRAVEAVAALLAEEGRELKDRKALRDAAGQYEFLAKAYPGSSLAAPGLGKALDLLGPEGVGDGVEAAKVRELLKERYSRSAAALAVGDRGVVGGRAPEAGGGDKSRRVGGTAGRTAKGETADSVDPEGARGVPLGRTTKKGDASVSDAGDAGSRFPVRGMTNRNAGASSTESRDPTSADNQQKVAGVAPAVVSGIRHWSTASYTRVAIDLGGEVEFQAARTEHPDRIFFDLHGATLAPGLAGKSFAITDEGFLKTIRAAQAKPDVTRIVLDVEPVAEYSAFLLPNPTRLIIDIHGKAAGQRGGEPGSQQASETAGQRGGGTDGQGVREQAAASAGAAPIERSAPGGGESAETGAVRDRGSAVSSLPPMPVTDGSAGFGLPVRRTEAVTVNRPVARPRVVVTSKPTAARPVPNAVSTPVAAGNREVAAVSEGPGVIAATATPTSKPVVDKGSGRGDAGAVVTSTGGETTTSKPVMAKGAGKSSGGKSSDRDSRITVAGSRASAGGAGAVAPVPAPPTADGQSTLMRALGLKIGRIVIDAGHGGHDSGTLGADGIEEKDVVLDVALRLGKLLHDRLGAEIVYTRADDTFIPLETRTAIANKAQADLFISVHANSSQDASARGVEVYYLNFTSDPEAMAVAGRENAVSSQRVNQLSDLVKKIALKDKIDESRELAADVDTSLYAGLRKGNEGLKDRGVKKAPFVVLIGANMPSILAEISFVTNPDDAEELNRPEYRERVAESLYKGIAQYAGGINGVPSGTKRLPRSERAALKQQPVDKN